MADFERLNLITKNLTNKKLQAKTVPTFKTKSNSDNLLNNKIICLPLLVNLLFLAEIKPQRIIAHGFVEQIKKQEQLLRHAKINTEPLSVKSSEPQCNLYL